MINAGSPPYMPPENFVDLRITGAASPIFDMFSAGVVIRELTSSKVRTNVHRFPCQLKLNACLLCIRRLAWNRRAPKTAPPTS